MRYEHHIFVCENLRDNSDERGSCQARGSAGIRPVMKKMIKEKGLKGKVRANQSGCLDACEHGPVVVVYPEGIWYGHVKPADVQEIIESHIENNTPVERLRIQDPKYL